MVDWIHLAEHKNEWWTIW